MVYIAAGVLVILLLWVGSGFLRKMGQARALDQGGSQAVEAISRRLESAASRLGGKLVEGPALETARGRLALMATRAPQDPEINVTKFTVPLSSPYALTVIPVADAAKAIQSKSLQPVEGVDPTVAAAYRVLSTDPDFGRRVAVPELAERLRALDGVAGARSRLQVAPHGATLFVEKGLEKPEDLQAFHDRGAEVVETFRKLAGG